MNGKLSPNITKYFIYKLVKAIGFLHERGISHRDIKPENIMICIKDFEPKIIDFGICDEFPLTDHKSGS